MKAAWYERTGNPREVFVLGELPDPEPGLGQVRVRLYSAGVNPKDIKQRSGWNAPNKLVQGLIIPGDDGAGVIDAVGPEVSGTRLGQRVWVYGARIDSTRGTAAEYVVVPDQQAVRLPDAVTFNDGAALGIPAMTAHRALFWDSPALALMGRHVLVSGAAGCVGLFAVQLAKWAGAYVIGTVSNEEKATRARQAGADHVINYRSEDVARRVKALIGKGVDLVVEVELGTNINASRAALAPHGVIAAYGSDQIPQVSLPFYSAEGVGMSIRFVVASGAPLAAKQSAVTDISAALGSGALRSIVGSCFPLACIAEAHDAVAQGRFAGKTVIELPVSG